MNCKNCKHCHEYRSLLTEAYGGFTYQCDLGKGHNGKTVGHHDNLYNKDYFREYKEYVKDCKDFEQKPPKPMV